MAQNKHEVYPNDLLNERVEEYAEEHGISVSATYKEAVRRMLQRQEIENDG